MIWEKRLFNLSFCGFQRLSLAVPIKDVLISQPKSFKLEPFGFLPSEAAEVLAALGIKDAELEKKLTTSTYEGLSVTCTPYDPPSRYVDRD